MPVRNGGLLLRHALDSVVGQTYENLEILISDNASTDDTAAICQEFAARDDRIRYIRHEAMLSATDNFVYVLKHTTGEYFMWAAHDDLRSPNFVERLSAALDAHPDAALAFGEAAGWDLDRPIEDALLIPRMPATRHCGFHARVSLPWRSCLPVYGLYRRPVLETYQHWYRPYATDVSLLAHVAVSGEILQVPGVQFYVYLGMSARGAAERATRETVIPRRSFHFLRLNIAAARAAVDAARLRGQERSTLVTFGRLQLAHGALRLRRWSADRLPAPVTGGVRDVIDRRRSRT